MDITTNSIGGIDIDYVYLFTKIFIIEILLLVLKWEIISYE